MREIKCKECGGVFEAESREQMLSTLYDHYMKEHNEVITNVTEEDKKIWMDRFEAEWKEQDSPEEK